MYTIIRLETQFSMYNYISILPLSNHTSTIVNVCAIILVDSMCMNDSRFVQFIIYVNDKCIVNIEFDGSRANFLSKKEKSVFFLFCLLLKFDQIKYIRPLIIYTNNSSFMKTIWIYIFIFKIPIIYNPFCQTTRN